MIEERYGYEEIANKPINNEGLKELFTKQRPTTEELKQKAEEWVKDNLENNAISFEEAEKRKQAYIAGATENGIQWHDLRKDPNDLPKDDVVLVQAKGGGHFIALYYPEDEHWGIYNMLAETLNREVITWCEIPQFKE